MVAVRITYWICLADLLFGDDMDDPSRRTTLEAIIAILDCAHRHKSTNAFVDDLLETLNNSVLPRGTELPNTRDRAIRSVLPALPIRHRRVDFCPGGCHIYYTADCRKQCPVCNKDRYDATGRALARFYYWPAAELFRAIFLSRHLSDLMRAHSRHVRRADGKVSTFWGRSASP
jgi:hypothetical protein